MPHLTSANLACGFHAGDFRVMEATVALCRRAGVAVGAQPGYPDLLGFGRRPMPFEPDEVESLVRYQIGALEAFCRANGVEMQHVKPHGALYNQAATDPALAAAIARAVGRFSRDLLLFGLASSEPMAAAAADAGLRFVPEAFADRRLRGRWHPPAPRSSRARSSPTRPSPPSEPWRSRPASRSRSSDGGRVAIRAESICCHGDTPGAVEIAAAVRRALEAAGVNVAAPTAGVIRPFGEAALLVDTGSAERAQALAAALHREPIPGVTRLHSGPAEPARRARSADRPSSRPFVTP